MKTKATKMTKITLVNAARKSRDLTEMTIRLGRSKEEVVWNKMLQIAPGCERFLDRNEAVFLMQDSIGEEDICKANRLDYLDATLSLMRDGFICNKADKNELAIAMKYVSQEDLDAIKAKKLEVFPNGIKEERTPFAAIDMMKLLSGVNEANEVEKELSEEIKELFFDKVERDG